MSVVIPVWNGEACVARAIDSALGQRFDGSVEIVVVNDGSTDQTQRALKPYSDRIRIIEQARCGRAAARNAAVAASRGEYIAFLDADDVWIREKLSKTVPALERNPRCVLVYSDAQWIDQRGAIDGTYVSPDTAHAPSLDEMLSRPWLIATPTVVIRRSTFEACNGFPERFALSYPGEDYYLWLLARQLGEFTYLPECLAACQRTPPAQGLEKHGLATWSGDAESYLRDLENRLSGYRISADLVRRRFGRRAGGLLAQIRRSETSVLVASGLAALARGERRAARLAYRSAMRRNPLEPKLPARLLWTYLPAAAARPLARLLPARLARALCGATPVPSLSPGK